MGMRLSKELQDQVLAQGTVTSTVQMPVLSPLPVSEGLKQTKYKNAKVYITPDGRYVGQDHTGPKKKIADSKKEFKRLRELQGMLAHGLISFLQYQVRFWLNGPNGTKITSYVCDFAYVMDGKLIVEDVKSSFTKGLRLYQIKRAWVRDQYGIDIVEI